MANPIDQREKPVLKELLEASKAAERLISALFEIGALDGEPFMSIWCQLDRAIERTQRSLGEKPALITSDLNPRPAA
jgi:hypothetical protein